MPPKVKITKEDIITAAIQLVRANGASALNARGIAAFLNCSTQPVFSNFASMVDLEQETINTAYQMYLDFIKNEAESGKYPKYKAFGMAYIRFAKEERELFKLLFMRDRTGEDLSPSTDFEASVQMIMEGCSVPRETAALMHMEIWSCVHGFAVMIATSFLPLDTGSVSDMISDVYHGLRTRHIYKENENGSN